jgi:hypothetical protein
LDTISSEHVHLFIDATLKTEGWHVQARPLARRVSATVLGLEHVGGQEGFSFMFKPQSASCRDAPAAVA